MADPLSVSSGQGTGYAQQFNTAGQSGYLDYKIKKELGTQAENKKNEANVYKSLAPLDKIDIFPRDQPIFKQHIQDVRDYTKKNIDKLRSGDADATMEFQQMLSDVYNEANLSKNTRENYEKFAYEVGTNADKYDPDTLDYLDKFATDPSNIGNYQFDPSQIVPKMDLMQDIKLNVKINPTSTGYEYVDQSTGETVKGDSKIVTQKEADAILEKRLFSNPNVYSSASKQYERAKKAGQTTAPDLVTWYKELGRPYLVQKDTSFSKKPVGKQKNYSFGGGTAKNDMYNFVYTPGKSKWVKNEDGTQTQTPETEQIDIASITTAENPFLQFEKDGQPVQVTPQKLYNEGDGVWYMQGVDKDGKTVDFKLDDISGDFEANYFINPNDLINQIKGQGTKQTGTKDIKQESKTTKLTGKINPSALVKGKSYEVNGKTYTWNGTKLVAQ